MSTRSASCFVLHKYNNDWLVLCAAAVGRLGLHAQLVSQHGVQGPAGAVPVLPAVCSCPAQAQPASGSHDCSGVRPVWRLQSSTPGLPSSLLFKLALCSVCLPKARLSVEHLANQHLRNVCGRLMRLSKPTVTKPACSACEACGSGNTGQDPIHFCDSVLALQHGSYAQACHTNQTLVTLAWTYIRQITALPV